MEERAVKLIVAAGLVATASAVAMAQAQAGNQSTTRTQAQFTQHTQLATTQQNAAQPKPGEQTLTGCLTAADNVYTLTVMDDSGAPGTTANTIAYTLAPGSGVDLKPLVDKRVTVKGTEAGPDAQSTARVAQSTGPAPAATGTSGANAPAAATDNAGASRATGATGANAGGANAGATIGRPTVQTQSKARITTKTLNITSVQPASGSCGA
jgi:hypothetical protein